jgi:hypothetical protein
MGGARGVGALPKSLAEAEIIVGVGSVLFELAYRRWASERLELPLC